jgi:hypothetical protein
VFRPNRYRRFRPDERALLDALLSGDEVGFDALRSQLDTASYKAAWFPGGASFDIHTDGGTPYLHAYASDAESAVVHAREVFRGGSSKTAEHLIGTLFVWVTDGYLSAVEYQSVAGRAPASLPSPAQLG